MSLSERRRLLALRPSSFVQEDAALFVVPARAATSTEFRRLSGAPSVSSYADLLRNGWWWLPGGIADPRLTLSGDDMRGFGDRLGDVGAKAPRTGGMRTEQRGADEMARETATGLLDAADAKGEMKVMPDDPAGRARADMI